MTDNFIQDMDEERRIYRLRVMMRRVGVLLVVLFLLGGIGGSIWGWRYHRFHAEQQEASNRYMQALNLLNREGLTGTGDSSSAQAKAGAILVDLVAHGPKGIQSYAAMRLAELKHQQGDTQAALKLWQNVVHADTADLALRGLARYLWLNTQADHLSSEALRKGYQALVQEGGSWASLAREGLVALDLCSGASKDQKAEARRLLLEIQTSPETSDSLRQRAQLLLQALGDAG